MTGILFVLVILGSIFIHPYLFAITFVAIASGAMHEFYRMTNSQPAVSIPPFIGIIGVFILFSLSFFYVNGWVNASFYALYGLYVMLVLIAELFRKQENPVNNWAYFLLSQVFIALPFSLLNFIYFMGNTPKLLLIAMFVMIWLNDTGAYLAGVTMGKHKMFKRVSPKKSWEGFAGGVLAALLTAYVLSLFITDIKLLHWLLIALCIVGFATLGDLMESLMKRTLNVKDSGSIMPGHGGFLDRFDSMLLAAPAYFLLLSLLLK